MFHIIVTLRYEQRMILYYRFLILNHNTEPKWSNVCANLKICFNSGDAQIEPARRIPVSFLRQSSHEKTKFCDILMSKNVRREIEELSIKRSTS